MVDSIISDTDQFKRLPPYYQTIWSCGSCTVSSPLHVGHENSMLASRLRLSVVTRASESVPSNLRKSNLLPAPQSCFVVHELFHPERTSFQASH